jgi:pantothenate synthetase
VDADTFEPVASLRGTCYIVLAAFVGGARLIDNALIEERDGAFLITI